MAITAPTSTLTVTRVLALGSLAGLVYAAFEARRLVSLYPLHEGTCAPAASSSLWPKGLGRAYEVRACTRIPGGADARETFIRAFYSTWTLRLEALAARTFTGFQSALPPPELLQSDASPSPAALASSSKTGAWSSTKVLPAHALGLAPTPTPPPTPAAPLTPPETPALHDLLPPHYASGLFQVLGRTPDCTMVWWGSSEGAGGAQLLTCKRSEPKNDKEISKPEHVQISYTCAETPFLQEDVPGWIGTKFHRMYMRFLLDQAAVRMEQWAHDSERL